MRKLTTAAIGAACLMLGAGGAIPIPTRLPGRRFTTCTKPTSPTKTRTRKRCRRSRKSSRRTAASIIAGGFNKAKTDFGKPETGNRFVIIRYDSDAAYDKFWNGGGKAWIEKYAPQARSVRVEGVEQK